MPDMEAIGWVPMWRQIQHSPVWRKPKALQLFIWLFLNAAHEERVDNSGGRPVALVRGEVYASLAQAVEACPLSVKEVRNAFAWLEAEGMIVRDSVSSVITITKYEEYQLGNTDDEQSLSGQVETAKKGKAETMENSLRDSEKTSYEDGIGAKQNLENWQGQGKGHSKTAKRGKAEKGENALRDSRKTPCEDGVRAKQNLKNGQGKGQGNGGKTDFALSSPSTRACAGETVVEEVIRNINPPTPFFKGGRDSSDSSALLGTDGERVKMVLAMWREERTDAGLSAFDGRRSLRGAKLLASKYLANAAMSVATLRGGMKKLIHDIASDPKCKLFDLLTLANNPERYCPAPVIVREKKRRVNWEFVCDVCGHAACSPAMDAALGTPSEQPCNYRGCQGTMRVVKAYEI